MQNQSPTAILKLKKKKNQKFKTKADILCVSLKILPVIDFQKKVLSILKKKEFGNVTVAAILFYTKIIMQLHIY